MTIKEVDVAIIGTGTAGMGAYREARKYTDRIALIESGDYGTTCARVGCMPSKLLIAAADAAYHARHTDLFGVTVSQVEIVGRKVMQRVRAERDRFVGFVLDDVNGFEEQHKIRGFARLIDDHTLLIDNYIELRAKRIVIATGSRPFITDIMQHAGKRLLVNDDVFELDDLPKSVLVAGTGVIGLELGQTLSRLGVDVTIIARSQSIGGIEDEEIREYAAKVLNNELQIYFDTHVEEIFESAKHVDVVLRDSKGFSQTKRVEYVIAATGRVPNTDNIGLENTSIKLDQRGIPQFSTDTMQTSVPHIFIAGDANSELPILHEASDEGRIAGKNAGQYPLINKGHRRAHLSVVFSDPQIAKVGLSQAALTKPYVTGRISFESQGRSRVMGVNKGILKIFADKHSGVFLGAEVFGPSAEHIAHLLSWAVQQRLTVTQILDMPFYHPVIEEGVRTAFREALSQLL